MVETASARKARHDGRVALPPATDLYNINSLLSEDERLVRDTVRDFVRERVLPIIGEHFEEDTFFDGPGGGICGDRSSRLALRGGLSKRG